MRGRLLLALASFLGAVACVEAGLRLGGFSWHLYPERIEFGAPDPVSLEREYRPDRRLLWVTGDYPLKLERMRQVRPDVVFMGDSCTQFGDYPARWAKAAPQGEGSPPVWESVGVAGWSSYQGLEQFRRDIAPLAPRVVTVFFGWNDHWYGFGVEDREVAWLRSRLFTALDSLRVVQLASKAWVAIQGSRRPERPLRVSLEDFRGNLRSMARLAREKGIALVLLTAPSSHEVGHEPGYLAHRWIEDLHQLVPLHESYAEAVRQVAREEGVRLCDLLQEFRLLPAEERRASFLSDGIHFTPRGNERVADLLRECFDRDGLWVGIRGGPRSAAKNSID